MTHLLVKKNITSDYSEQKEQMTEIVSNHQLLTCNSHDQIDEYLNDKSEKIKIIHEDITQLKHIFIDLNKLVENQQNNIDMIEDYVDITLELVKEAEKELNIAEDYQDQTTTLKYFAFSVPIILGIAAIYEVAK